MNQQSRAVVATLGNTSREEVASWMRAGLRGIKASQIYLSTMRENAHLRTENARLQRLADHYQGERCARYRRHTAHAESWSLARFAIDWGVRTAGLVLVVGGAVGWIVGMHG